MPLRHDRPYHRPVGASPGATAWDQLLGTHFDPGDRDGPEQVEIGRMPDPPLEFWELERVPLDWGMIRERNADR